jgi:hypothetical protein
VKPPAGEWPVVDLVLPLPMTVAADVYRAIGRGLEQRGYQVFIRESHGIGRVFARFPAHAADQDEQGTTTTTAGAPGDGGR